MTKIATARRLLALGLFGLASACTSAAEREHQPDTASANAAAPSAMPATAGDAGPGDAQAPATDVAIPSWTYRETTDPMNDMPVHQAIGVVNGEAYRFEVTIECRSEHLFSYEFRAFRHNGAPAMFRSRFVGSTPLGDNGEIIAMQARPDGGRSFVVIGNPRAMNQARFTSFGMINRGAITATDLVLQLPMVDREETLRIDQSEPAIASALLPCQPPRVAAPRDAPEEIEVPTGVATNEADAAELQ